MLQVEDIYSYAIGVLESSWPELDFDIHHHRITARVVAEQPLNQQGIVTCIIAKYLDDQQMKGTIAGSKRLEVDQLNGTAYWNEHALGLQPIIRPLSKNQMLPLWGAEDAAYKNWIPVVPTFERAANYLTQNKERLFRNRWMSFTPPSMVRLSKKWEAKGVVLRYRADTAHVAFVHWLDGTTYWVTRGVTKLFISAREAVMQGYRDLLTELRTQGLPSGEIRTDPETQDDLDYLNKIIAEFEEFAVSEKAPVFKTVD